jgi:hypothetical protein
MEVKVAKFTVKVQNYQSQLSDFKEWQGELKKFDIKLSEFLPKRDKYIVDIELHNCHAGFANMIRAAILDGVPSWRFNKITTTTLTDPYILLSDLETNIRSIPLNQTVLNEYKGNLLKDIKTVLYKETGPNIYSDITTADITTKINNKPVELCEDIIPIQKLSLASVISVQLLLHRTNGYENACFSNIENIRYNNLDKQGHVLSGNPQKWHIGWTQHRGFSYKLELFEHLIAYLIELFNDVEHHLHEAHESKMNVYSDSDNKFTLDKNGGLYVLYQPMFVSNVISHEVYTLKPNVGFISATNTPNELQTIKIIDDDYKKIMEDAVKSIKKNIISLFEQVKKFN